MSKRSWDIRSIAWQVAVGLFAAGLLVLALVVSSGHAEAPRARAAPVSAAP